MADDQQQAGQDFDWFRHGDRTAQDQEEPPEIRAEGVPAGPVLPPIVFVSSLVDGGLFLQSWPKGPPIHLNPWEAEALRRELAAVYLRGEQLRRSQDEQ